MSLSISMANNSTHNICSILRCIRFKIRIFFRIIVWLKSNNPTINYLFSIFPSSYNQFLKLNFIVFSLQESIMLLSLYKKLIRMVIFHRIWSNFGAGGNEYWQCGVESVQKDGTIRLLVGIWWFCSDTHFQFARLLNILLW